MIRAINYVINQKGWCLYWGTAKWSSVEVKLFINSLELKLVNTFTIYNSR